MDTRYIGQGAFQNKLYYKNQKDHKDQQENPEKKEQSNLPSLLSGEIKTIFLPWKNYRKRETAPAEGQMRKWAKHKTNISLIVTLSQVLNLITIVLRLGSHDRFIW